MVYAVAAFAQKNEIKAAEKAKSLDFASNFESASSLIDAADGLKDFKPAIDAFKKVLSIEEASGKKKYTAPAEQKMAQMAGDIVNSAVESNNEKDFASGAEKLYLAYQLRPQDTIYLYYAASSAVNGKDYPKALEYYNKLNDLNYDGSGVTYTAVNVATGEVDPMDKTTRDLYVKAGTHKDPKDETTPSKRPEIIKNIALIYQQEGQNEKALAAYDDAIATNPDDVNLVLNKANLYYTMGDKEQFKTLMGRAAEMAPDNADLHYNIGVISMEQNNIEDARAAQKVSLEIDPSYTNALLNLSTTCE